MGFWASWRNLSIHLSTHPSIYPSIYYNYNQWCVCNSTEYFVQTLKSLLSNNSLLSNCSCYIQTSFWTKLWLTHPLNSEMPRGTQIHLRNARRNGFVWLFLRKSFTDGFWGMCSDFIPLDSASFSRQGFLDYFWSVYVNSFFNAGNDLTPSVCGNIAAPASSSHIWSRCYCFERILSVFYSRSFSVLLFLK